MNSTNKKNIISIGGEEFKLTTKKDILYHYINSSFKNIYNCYDRPSQYKVNIYNYYYNLLKNNSTLIDYGVASYNGFFIQLEALVILNNKKYYVYITRSYNYIMEVE